MRASADRLQLVPQPTLPQVPGHRRGAVDGSKGSRASCLSSTFMWFLRFPRRSVRSRFRINGRSTAFCSEPPPKRYGKSPPIPSTSGPRSVSWPSSTPGAKTFNTILMCIASCREVGWLPMARVGSPAGHGFFLPVRVLSRVFRGKFLALLRSAFDQGRLSFHGKLASLADPREFQLQLAASARTEWVVYAKPPWGGPEQVLKYLSRYTHRVAISNQRLVDLENGEVRFHWKDYAHQGATKTMKLKAIEFIRRFLLHVLPLCFVRIRHYGFLANRVRQEKLALCRLLLNDDTTSEPLSAPKEPVEGQSTANVCPSCGKGRMVIVRDLSADADPSKRRGVVASSRARPDSIRPDPL